MSLIFFIENTMHFSFNVQMNISSQYRSEKSLLKIWSLLYKKRGKVAFV